MKRVLFAILSAMLAVPVAAFAQNNDYNHAEVSAFGDYFRANGANTNLFGVGGRLGFAVNPHVKLEVDGAYDFAHNVSNDVTGLCPGGVSTTTTPSCGTSTVGLRATHFSFGPKFQIGTHQGLRAFVFAKGGFVRFAASNVPVTFGNFPTELRGTDLNGVFYPGGGIEAFAGWFGFRGDVGDEIFFDRGAHSNLRITFGPVIRF
ncbi:MAG TPA: hypothetical protein VGC88_09870 [Terriglobales bacterium]|jgi:hypothetical protein